ncbi:uncharacterized protein LOC107361911 [Tetranychus urticae]|uniref:uncharacterized protein LOC107361911 n=1 Tax=Tetranychus urticae TaxID=32264 RepID=UPI00077BE917|nr:uncharacterized protein LOC107361911 [Tetranychus urticae]
MNIDKLPDDCLFLIFNLLNNFETLMNCASVCERWKHLVFKRLKTVKYLTNSLERDRYPAGTIYFSEDDRLEQIGTSKWFPKLKILDLCEWHYLDLISNLPVKGLQLLSYYGYLDNITLDIPSVEMIAAQDFYNSFANAKQGPKIEQLYILHCNVSRFSRHAKYFPNLKRLHIEDVRTYAPFVDKCYTGPVLEKLEILEISLFAEYAEFFNKKYYGFSLADHCPALKSAFHVIQSREPFVNSEIKNYVLEDLVLLFGCDWSILRCILSKYPNLKHLAIRGGTYISDENIPELLKLLPRLTLIDVRDSQEVTEKSADYIDWYCQRRNRSISFYYRHNGTEITKEWPNSLTKHVRIGRGLDFMKWCFFRDFDDMPFLLDPDE